MELPLYKVTLHLIFSGFRNLPVLSPDIQTIITKTCIL